VNIDHKNTGYKILISHACIYKKAGWGRIFPLAKGIANQGNNVTILTTNPGFSIFTKKEKIGNVDIIIYPEIIPVRISKMGFGFLSLIFKIIHVGFHKYDIVHSDNGHRPLSGIPCRLHKWLHNSVYVAEWYDWYGRGGQYDNKKFLFKLLLGRYELRYELKDKKFADGIVVLSEVLRERASLIKTADRVVKIQGGADVSGIPFISDNTEIKQKFNIPGNTITFGYINSSSYRLAEFMPLIESLERLGFSGYQILVFGESSSLEKQLPVHIAKHIKFFGWINYSQEYEKLQLVDIFFLFKENILGNKAGWPNCVGDYLACGRPILINPVGEMVDFVKLYPEYFIVTTNNIDDIVDKIDHIRSNLDVYRNKGTNIRQFALENTSWEKKSKELMDFYNYLISQSKN
jgi:glycosyltransferase involved in cell wall biosynthesis